MTVGEKIRRLRESLGLTQAEFAKAIGDFSKQTISRWEKPNSSVPYSAQKKILQAFNLSTFQLLDDDLIDTIEPNCNDERIQRIMDDYKKLPTESKIKVLKFIIGDNE